MKISKKTLRDFNRKIFGDPEEIEAGIKGNPESKIKESVVVQGTLFSKGKWVVEEEKTDK